MMIRERRVSKVRRGSLYSDTLCHFNPNHDPRNGQFTSAKGIMRSAHKGVKIQNSRFKPWYRAYDPLLKNKGLNRALDSNEQLIESRKQTSRLQDEWNKAAEAVEQQEMIDFEKAIENPASYTPSQILLSLTNKSEEAGKRYEESYERTRQIAKDTIDKILDNHGELSIRSPEYRLLVEYAQKFFPTAPGREKNNLFYEERG